jgi:hypothetical protein
MNRRRAENEHRKDTGRTDRGCTEKGTRIERG